MKYNQWIPQVPHPKQQEFLFLDGVREVLYGGAAGSGKTGALLMVATQYVDVPGYAALILRRTFRDLNQPDAIIPRSKEWWMGKASWSHQDKRWTFPSGATITFGYLDHEDDVYQYQGSAFQTVCFDELTQFTETQYLYLFSRLRKAAESTIPIRMRSATNPGGPGHQWVKDRFIENTDKTRQFIPARLDDNPSLDKEEYVRSLNLLDPMTRQQLLLGDWVRNDGAMFKRHWFKVVDDAPTVKQTVRCWDLAATEAKKGSDPDWTAGVKMGVTTEGTYVVLDIQRARLTPGGVESLIRQAAEVDGRDVPIWMEQEPGSSGVNVIDHYTRRVLQGFNFHGERSTGEKATRAAPMASMAEAGNVSILRGPHTKAFLDEAEMFPVGTHDDMVDAAAFCFLKLSRPRRAVNIWT